MFWLHHCQEKAVKFLRLSATSFEMLLSIPRRNSNHHDDRGGNRYEHN